jgi:hypothetical protein
MGKGMSIAGMVIGGMVVLLFVLNLAAGFPFGGSGGMVVNIGFALCGGMLAYLGWSAFRDAQ